MVITSNFQAQGNFTFALQSALSAYSDEMYTNAKKLSGTMIVGTNAQIDPSTETYIGQTRFFKPFSNQKVNVASTDNSTAAQIDNAAKQDYTSDFLTYIKTVRTFGAREINVQRVISMQDGLAKIARDFGEVRAQDEHESIMAVLRGAAAAEVGYGSRRISSTAAEFLGGLNNFGHDYGLAPTAAATTGTAPAIGARGVGFYCDINGGSTGPTVGDSAFGAPATGASDERDLIMGSSNPGTSGYGAILGENLFRAISLGYADYEPDYMYMITSPEVMTQLRVANLVDQTKVTEGNLQFDTIFGGKFRLLMSRTNQGNLSAEAGVNSRSVRTTFLVKPGAIEMGQLAVPMPVEMFRDANTYNGGGSTDIWYRWGYATHPMGYNWTNSGATGFAQSISPNRDVPRAGALPATATANLDLNNGTNWDRRFDLLNLGILPIFHA